jgi:hypothetical protein
MPTPPYKFKYSEPRGIIEPDRRVYPVATFTYDGLKSVLPTPGQRLSHVAVYYTYYVHHCLRKADGSWLPLHDMEEACQEALGNMWVMIGHGSEPRDYLATYVCIAYCRAADIGRDREREDRALEQRAYTMDRHGGSTVGDALERAEVQELVHRAISLLPGRQEKVLGTFVRHGDNLPARGMPKELARVMTLESGQPENDEAVRSLWYDGIERMGKLLIRLGYEPRVGRG